MIKGNSSADDSWEQNRRRIDAQMEKLVALVSAPVLRAEIVRYFEESARSKIDAQLPGPNAIIAQLEAERERHDGNIGLHLEDGYLPPFHRFIAHLAKRAIVRCGIAFESSGMDHFHDALALDAAMLDAEVNFARQEIVYRWRDGLLRAAEHVELSRRGGQTVVLNTELLPFGDYEAIDLSGRFRGEPDPAPHQRSWCEDFEDELVGDGSYIALDRRGLWEVWRHFVVLLAEYLTAEIGRSSGEFGYLVQLSGNNDDCEYVLRKDGSQFVFAWRRK